MNHSLELIFALPTCFKPEDILVSNLKAFQKQQGFLPDAMLFNLLTVDAESTLRPPYAAIAAKGAGMEVGEDYWLRMDPVELLLDGANVYLIGQDHLLLEEFESEQLLNSLNHFLEQDGLYIQAASPNEWYCQLAQRPGIQTHTLSQAIGQDIRALLPSGPEQNKWRQLMTELQMLLFQHVVNNQRQQALKPLVNSVWLWGEGAVVKPYRLKDYAAIWSDHHFVNGLLALSDNSIPWFHSQHFSMACLNKPGRYLLVMNQWNAQQLQRDINAIIDYVHTRYLHKFTLYFGNNDVYTLTRKRRRIFSFRGSY